MKTKKHFPTSLSTHNAIPCRTMLQKSKSIHNNIKFTLTCLYISDDIKGGSIWICCIRSEFITRKLIPLTNFLRLCWYSDRMLLLVNILLSADIFLEYLSCCWTFDTHSEQKETHTKFSRLHFEPNLVPIKILLASLITLIVFPSIVDFNSILLCRILFFVSIIDMWAHH